MFQIQVSFAGTVSFVNDDLKLSGEKYSHTFSSFVSARSAKKSIEQKYGGSVKIVEV